MNGHGVGGVLSRSQRGSVAIDHDVLGRLPRIFGNEGKTLGWYPARRDQLGPFALASPFLHGVVGEQAPKDIDPVHHDLPMTNE